MSYLAGMISFDGRWQAEPRQARQLLAKAAEALQRRGSGGGVYLDERAALCGVAAEDPRHALALDAALYNSSAEALLTGLTAQGSKALEALNAMFALAFWDGETLLLARDRIGARPLFYAEDDGLFYFGSEPKALFAMGLRPAIDHRSLRELFALGPARTPGCGVFKGVQELLPGEWLRYGSAGLRRGSYWQLQSRPHTDSHDTTIETIRSLVEDSVARQMSAPLPLCSFLSGGLDSSLVSAICAQRLREQGQRLTTFSFDFEGNDEFYQANAFQPGRDTPFAREMAAYLGSEHIELSCGSEDLANLLDDAMRARDLPGMADVDASLLYFCRAVGQDFAAAMTGEASDELFGGYPWFRSETAFRERRFPWSDPAARRSFLREDVLDALDLEDYARQACEDSAAQTPRCETDTPEEARRREIAWLNLRWFLQTLLDRMDRMGGGLCGHVPLADHRLLEYVWNIPWALKYKDEIPKYSLRMAGQGWLPEQVLWRKKSPFPKTYNPRYEALLAQRMRDLLASPGEPLHRFVDKTKAEAFLSAPADYGRPWYGQLMAAPQRVAYFLQVNAWLKEYQV